MSLFNTYTVTVKRKTLGSYSGAGNKWVPGTGTTLYAKGSWQPANGNDQQPLPEGKRSNSVYKFYTSTSLRIVNAITQEDGDIAISPLDGLEYEVSAEGVNQNNIISNNKYILTRKKEATE